MNLLGLSFQHQDSAACLVIDGEIVAAAQEERFSRRKLDPGFPLQAIVYCLRQAGLRLADLDVVAFEAEPGSNAQAATAGVQQGLAQCEADGAAIDWRDRLLHVPRHVCQASSAFFASPFDSAAVLTIDGPSHRMGNRSSTALATGAGNRLDTRWTQVDSPGRLYSALTAYLGFKVGSGQYKVMGLAPYGQPRYAELMLSQLLRPAARGGFAFNPDYVDLDQPALLASAPLCALLGSPPRLAESALTQREMDIAASLQVVTQQWVLGLARAAVADTGMVNLCLAGEVALNCVANGQLARQHVVERIWVQPAAGNAGSAVGAALAAYHLQHGGPRRRGDQDGKDGMQGTYLGPAYAQDDIERRLTALGAVYATVGDEQLFDTTARCLAQGKAVGWFQGRMEFGPRALGNRSILGDARSPQMQVRLNASVKYRENFRPFAPSVLQEDAAAWFELDCDSPYMQFVVPVHPDQRIALTPAQQALQGLDRLAARRSTIAAATHVDYSARLQTVRRTDNARYHALLSRFKALTGCPVLLNTSFNVRGEPIVCSPEDAYRCFMGADIDMLVVGNCILLKEQQPAHLLRHLQGAYPLD